MLNCSFTTSGLSGLPTSATVSCAVPVEGGTGLSFSCPLMILTRTAVAPVGGYAACGSSLSTGVGTGTATTRGNLGRVESQITCGAYVNVGVLVPPYTVTCSEPGAPTVPALDDLP